MAKRQPKQDAAWYKTKLDQNPWGKVYMQRWFNSDTHRRMSNAERGIFWDLICIQHMEGGVVPNDPKELSEKLHNRGTSVTRFWHKYGPDGAQVWRVCGTGGALACNDNYNNSNPNNCLHPAVAGIKKKIEEEEAEKSGSPTESVLTALENIDFSQEPNLTVK